MPQSPMYRNIADDLRAKIQDGSLPPNAKLPTESELSEQYAASRNTVREAIRRLTDEGLLESRPGQGTFVARKLDPFVTVLTVDAKSGFGGGENAAYLSEVRDDHREPGNTVPTVEVQTASAAVAALLEIAPMTQVVSRSQNRLIDGVNWSKQTTFYLMDFVLKGANNLLMAQDIEGGAVAYLANEIGVRQTGYRDWITGRLAGEDEQDFFGIGNNAAVFVHSRIAFDQDNKPMRATITIFPVDRNQLVYNVGPNVPSLTPASNPGRKSDIQDGACDLGEPAQFANRLLANSQPSDTVVCWPILSRSMGHRDAGRISLAAQVSAVFCRQTTVISRGFYAYQSCMEST